MKPEALLSLTYGMYAIGVTDGEKPSACIVNTVVQVSNHPNILMLTMSHNNYSHSCIQKSGFFYSQHLKRRYIRRCDWRTRPYLRSRLQ